MNNNVINFLSLLTIAGDVIIIGMVGLLVIRFVFKKQLRLLTWVGQNAFQHSLIVALLATLGSLFLSEIAHFTPCRLCWFQRIAMYPLVVVFGVAWYKKDQVAAWLQGMIIAGVGAIIAGYHYYIQVLSTSGIPCSIYDPVSCTEKVFVHYGYITIPMMALTAFVMIILFLIAQKVRPVESAQINV